MTRPRSVSPLVLLFFLLLLSPAHGIRSFPAELEKINVGLQEKRGGSSEYVEAPEYLNGEKCAQETSEPTSECSPSLVHVAMTLDFKYLRGSIAAVHSVLKHAACPENIFFHFIASESDCIPEYDNLTTIVRSTFPSLAFRIYPFDQKRIENLISSSIRPALDNPLNYARNYLADIIEPCVERVVYLDSDVILVDDIQNLWSVKLTGSRAIGAPEYCHANFTKYFTDEFWSNREYSKVFEGKRPCYFNTGVMVMDLVRWRRADYTQKIERWMEIQKQKRIYELGSLPPFLLVFGGDIEGIDHRWNQHGLGGDNLVHSCRSLHPGPVSLLHWSGKGKPWVRLDEGVPCPVDHLWAPYDLYTTHGLPKHHNQR